jgi:hypothetical protein
LNISWLAEVNPPPLTLTVSAPEFCIATMGLNDPRQALAGMSVTLAEPEYDGASALVAATVTAAGDGTAVGGMKRPSADINPTVELPSFVPLTLQTTPVAFNGPLTVAVNCCVQPSGTVALGGVTVTVSGPDVRFTCADADLVVSAWLTAVMVTPPEEGMAAGAL